MDSRHGGVASDDHGDDWDMDIDEGKSDASAKLAAYGTVMLRPTTPTPHTRHHGHPRSEPKASKEVRNLSPILCFSNSNKCPLEQLQVRARVLLAFIGFLERGLAPLFCT